jgi:PAS domain S-box-containing protein
MFFHKNKPVSQPSSHEEGLRAIVSDLRQSVAWTDLVFAHISESICVVGKDGMIKFANDAFAALVGETRILLFGQPIWKIMYVTPNGNGATPLTASTLAKAWSADNANLLDGSYSFKDKQISLNAHYISGIEQMIFVIRDVSEADQARRAAEETAKHLLLEQTRVQEAAAKEDAMLRSIGDAVIASDKEGNLTFMNSGAERLLDLDASKFIGKSIFDFLQFYDENDTIVPREDRLLTRALRTGQRQSNEEGGRSYYHFPDGRKISVSIIIAPVILKGNIIGAIGIYRDVTHAQEIDRMKTEFISLASHQLRTPLSSIKWYSEMLLAGDAGALNEEQNEFSMNIAQSTDRMIQLVNSLLNISRLESGRIIVDPKPTDLKKVVEGVIEELHEQIEERQQTLIVSVHENLGKVMLDQRLIEQVYVSLLTNAVRYTPQHGEITVLISANGDSIVSQISDNGLGVPQSQQSKLFDKFFRATNAVKIETDGNGLGLYLVKAIVESSGGKVWFKSEEGKGSSFWFSVPKTGMAARQGEVVLETQHKSNPSLPASGKT